MFMAEVAERKNFGYPPFFRLFKIDVKHKEQQVAHEGALRLATLLREVLGHRVFGPEVPLVGRVRNYYIFGILLKIERTGISIAKVKEQLTVALQDRKSTRLNSSH